MSTDVDTTPTVDGSSHPMETAARVAAQLTGNLTALDTTGRDLPADHAFLVLMVTDLTRQVHRLAQAIGGAP